MAQTNAERQAAYKARIAARLAGLPPPEPARVAKARKLTRPQRWKSAILDLMRILDEYEAWHGRMPASLGETAMAERIGETLELRELVEQLADAQLPKGFGRD